MSCRTVIPLLKFLVVDDVPENRFLVSKSLLKQFPASMVQECEKWTPAIAAARRGVAAHRAEARAGGR